MKKELKDLENIINYLKNNVRNELEKSKDRLGRLLLVHAINQQNMNQGLFQILQDILNHCNNYYRSIYSAVNNYTLKLTINF